jgi:hypothetical protein
MINLDLNVAIFLSSCDTPQSPSSDHRPAPFSETNTGPAPNQETLATPPASATEDTISPPPSPVADRGAWDRRVPQFRQSEAGAVASASSSTVNSPTFDDPQDQEFRRRPHGQTVALGGLIQNQVNKRKSGVPILSDIAGLGLLFSTTNDTTMRTELLVLITPRIIRSGSDAAVVTNELRERVQVVGPLVRMR